MRTSLLSLLLACATILHAQTYYYIDAIAVQPAQPTSADDINIDLVGGLSSSGAYIASSSAAVTGNTVTISIVAADPGGLAVIVPHTETVNVGQLPAGTYTIEFNAVNAGDFAPEPQHTFVVGGGGGSSCDSLEIISVWYGAFSDTAIVVHLNNGSTNIFSYPNFILLDANGDTLAAETTSSFGFVGESWHILAVQEGAVLPTGPFEGTLQLWTLFTTELACEWNTTFDLCPPPPCADLVPTLQNFGGGLVIGLFNWSITDTDAMVVASGQFQMTDTAQYDTAHVCLPPGNYAMIVTPLGDPTGGQPVFNVATEGFISGPSQAVTWIPPVPMPFSFYAPCADISEGLAEIAAGTLIVQPIGNGVRVWRTDGGAIGPVSLFDAQGRLLARGSSNSSELLLPLHDHAPGLLILQTLQGRLKVMSGW